jgi:hypothetical protein
MEVVLPGVHDRMSAMHGDVALGRLEVKNCLLEVKNCSFEVEKVVRQSEDGALQVVKLITHASQLTQLNGGAGGGAGQASPAPPSTVNDKLLLLPMTMTMTTTTTRMTTTSERPRGTL